VRLRSAKTARKPPRPVLPGGRSPYRGTFIAVFTVMVVLAIPLVTANVAEPKVHEMPGTADEQDRATLPVKPPDGVTVTISGEDI
jgi:hypothetical protein